MAFGENGLVKYAEEARDKTANSTITEAEEMNKLVDEYANVLAENSNTPEEFVDILPTKPKISDGMTPVKYVEGKGWIKTTTGDREWYDYSQKKWANIVLGDASWQEEGEKEILDEEKAYSMLVWIPRYAYQITSGYHQSGSEINPSNGTTGAGNIDIVFIDTANKNKTGTTTYNETYPSVTGTKMDDYVVHPAFNYGGTKLSGFWVGKYETSHTRCTTEKSTGETDTNVTTLTPMIKAGVTSWRNIQVSNIFTVCTSMNDEGNPYGLNTSDNIVNPHMMKNSEWGAVAYLSKSKYGKEKEEVWKNPNSNFITGQAGNSVSALGSISTNEYNTTNGMKASTTENVTGIYDMSGGSYEYVAGYVNNGHSSIKTNGLELVNSESKYKDVYMSATENGSDTQEEDYNYTRPTVNTGHYGDAVWETSSSTISPNLNSWYSDTSSFPCSNSVFFIRGGDWANSSYAGVFDFSLFEGCMYHSISFRLVIPVM